jgi:hypothetical protein
LLKTALELLLVFTSTGVFGTTLYKFHVPAIEVEQVTVPLVEDDAAAGLESFLQLIKNTPANNNKTKIFLFMRFSDRTWLYHDNSGSTRQPHPISSPLHFRHLSRQPVPNPRLNNSYQCFQAVTPDLFHIGTLEPI